MNKKTENKMILIESAAVDLRLQSLYDQLNNCKTNECVRVTQSEIDKLEKKTNWLKVAAALSAAGIGAGALGYGAIESILTGQSLAAERAKLNGTYTDEKYDLKRESGIKHLLNNIPAFLKMGIKRRSFRAELEKWKNTLGLLPQSKSKTPSTYSNIAKTVTQNLQNARDNSFTGIAARQLNNARRDAEYYGNKAARIKNNLFSDEEKTPSLASQLSDIKNIGKQIKEIPGNVASRLGQNNINNIRQSINNIPLKIKDILDIYNIDNYNKKREEEDAIRWALNNAGKGYDYVKNLSSVHNLPQSKMEVPTSSSSDINVGGDSLASQIVNLLNTKGYNIKYPPK